MCQQMKSISKQRSMGCARKPKTPPGRADEAGGFVRDKVRRGQNVALRSPKLGFLCPRNWFFSE